MPTRKVMVTPTTTSIASYVKKNAIHVKTSQTHVHQKNETIREADYKGHHIMVRTQYEIEVDGHMVMGHMGVTNDGHVHYHPLQICLSAQRLISLNSSLIRSPTIFPRRVLARGVA